jgi:hypothetical protein
VVSIMPPEPDSKTDRPRRIQRRRTKGWRMPEGAVYVGRGKGDYGRWGNPYRVLPAHGGGWKVQGNGRTMWSADDDHPWTREYAIEIAVEQFREHLHPRSVRARDAEIQLGGRDLVCWCPLDQPCHADVLLEIANGGAR